MGNSPPQQKKNDRDRDFDTLDPMDSLDPMVVRMQKVISKKGSAMAISGRYTRSRGLEEDYEVQEKVLGTGMNGSVRLATSRANGRRFALKSFKKGGLKSSQRQALRNEVELYLQLDHPHIAKLEMVFEMDEALHLVMECMEGGELYERLKNNKKYSESVAADAVFQMILAVAYLHEKRIAHRDLKLENFLYERKDTNSIKLIDFGLAKFWDPSTKMSQACGSIHYVAPEVLSQSYTTQADMWSMGVITYMLLTGNTIFTGPDSVILAKVKAGRPHFSPSFERLSHAAQSFVRTLLVSDPKKRLTAAQALEHSWLMGRNQLSSPSIDAGIIGCLREFAEASRFRRAALGMMAWSLTTEEQSELRDTFLLMDADKSGSITLSDLKEALKENFHVDGTEAEELFRMMNSDHSHKIEYSEFLAAALARRVNAHEELLRRTFARFDLDGNGFIGADDLREVLGESYEDAEMDELIMSADTKGDGLIDYDEFLAYFQTPIRRSVTEKLCLTLDRLLVEEEDDEGPEWSSQPLLSRRSSTSPLLPKLLGNEVAAQCETKAARQIRRAQSVPLSQQLRGRRPSTSSSTASTESRSASRCSSGSSQESAETLLWL